jgi:hypothetical protein
MGFTGAGDGVERAAKYLHQAIPKGTEIVTAFNITANVSSQ